MLGFANKLKISAIVFACTGLHHIKYFPAVKYVWGFKKHLYKGHTLRSLIILVHCNLLREDNLSKGRLPNMSIIWMFHCIICTLT